MEGFCRACLVKYDLPTYLLQYSEKNRRLFVYCTGIQVKRNDTFPFQLCKNCYVNMKVACKFKKLCRGSDKSIKNYQALKETGVVVDFCSFMKNIDDASMFRLPLITDSSTPAHNRSKDDDNVSTSTSIRNFMTDILRVDEIPDTEARIIREVIEEEADILEDSLDTHWLRDEASFDNEYRLDFSFSPFTTPRHVLNDHCYTPHKADENSRSSLQLSAIKRLLDIPVKPQSPLLESPIGSQNEKDLEKDEEIKTEKDVQQEFSPRFYVEYNDVANELDDKSDRLKNRCVIDSNLDRALKNEENDVYCLDDILVTPPGASAVSTPTIHNILFGKKDDNDSLYQYIEKLKDGKDDDDNEPIYEYVEKYENIKSESDDDDDIPLSKYIEKYDDRKQDDENNDVGLTDFSLVEEFINKDLPSVNDSTKADDDNTDFDVLADFYKDNDESPNNDPQNVTDQYDLTKLSCKLCKNKTFKNLRAITTHFYRQHKIHIKHKTKHIKKKRIRKPVLCPHCGKNYYDRPNLLRHLRQVENKTNEVPECSRCGQTFKSEAKLRMHMRSHGIMPTETPEKTCTCGICGKSFCKTESLTMHMRRVHEGYVRVFCDTCGKGFQRKIDLVVHLRKHNGEKPFSCLYCDKNFSRRDNLTKHINRHLGENRYECCYCGKVYSTLRTLKKHIEISEICMKFRLERKLKEDDRTKKISKKTRFFVIKPKPLESMQYPNNGEMPTEIDSDIGFQSHYLQSNGMAATDFDARDLITPLASPQIGDTQDLVTLVTSPKNRGADLATLQNRYELVTSKNGAVGLTTSQKGAADLATSQKGAEDLATSQKGAAHLATSQNAAANSATSLNAAANSATQDEMATLTLSPAVLSLPLLI